jgi:hypothetical protein
MGTRNSDIVPPDYANVTTASGDVVIVSVTDDRRFEAAPRDPSVPSVDGALGRTGKDQLATLIGRQRNAYGAALGGIALPQGMTVMDASGY